MSLNGTHTPFSGQAHARQGQDAPGADLSPGGRDRNGGDRNGAGARQGDRFGHALAKAFAAARPTELDEKTEVNAVAMSPLMPFSPLSPAPQDAAAQHARADVAGIADRIARYLRGAEGASSLRQGEGMVVKLPGNALGVSQVALRLEGDVLVVSLTMQAQAAAAQVSVLGQAIQSRTRHTVRLETEGEGAAPEDAPFNPLMPRGRDA